MTISNGMKILIHCGLLFTCLTFIGVNTAQSQGSQQPKALTVQSLARAYGDSVVLRWAPEETTTWVMTRARGYRIFRFEVDSFRLSKSSKPIELTQSPVYPLTHHEIITRYKDRDTLVSLVDMAMYSNIDSIVSKPEASFVEHFKAMNTSTNMLFMYAMQAADRSIHAANAAGLRWVDKGVKPGGKYLYMIVSDTSNKSYRIDTTFLRVINEPMNPKPVPENLRAIAQDKQIELHWNREQPGGFSTYNIERSDDEGKTWKSLTRLPYYSPFSSSMEDEAAEKKDSVGMKVVSILKYNQVYVDSIPENYKEYQYRISGNDAFAETSPYSAVIKTHGIDLTPPAVPQITALQNIKDNWIKIEWNRNMEDGDLSGYYVYRGPTFNGPFEPLTEKLLSKQTTTFTDTASFYDQGTFYIVMAVDTALNVATSFPKMAMLHDSIPPSAPRNISGLVDSIGIVSLQWDENPEPDVKGYKVYYSYNRDGGYSQVTGYETAVNNYQDTIPLQNMDRKVYYKVVAVDFHNNHSGYSDPVALDRPIYVPPTKPRANSIYIVEDGVYTEWIGSHSMGVSGYELFRRDRSSDWVSLAKFGWDNQYSFEYTDTAIHPNTEYFYAAESIDETGIRSEKSDPVRIVYTRTDVLQPVSNLSASYDEKKKEVSLRWDYKPVQGCFFVIYRAKNNEAMEMFQSVDGDKLTFSDYPKQKETYHYAVEVHNQDSGLRSERSKEVFVKVE